MRHGGNDAAVPLAFEQGRVDTMKNEHSGRAARVESSNGLHEWLSSLPWIVERPDPLAMPGIRTYAVACEPLGVRQLLLVTGRSGGRSIDVVVPNVVAARCEHAGLGRTVAPMPAEHALLAVRAGASRDEVERVILQAYDAALA